LNSQMPVLKEPPRKRRGSRRLLAILLLLFISLLAVLFFNSSISKISNIEVGSNVFVKTEDVIQAAGIAVGDPFFLNVSSTIEERVKSIKQVEEVKVVKTFPGKISINVQEYKVVAFELASDGDIVALLANGSSANARNDATLLVDKPVLNGWSADDPNKAALTKQLSLISPQELSDMSEIVPIPSNAYPDRIRIYTRTQFEVITAVSVLAEKIEAMNAVIESQEPGKITMLLADTYVPFERDLLENIETDEKGTTQ